MVKNKFFHTLESIWLCIRFPFLYPRNRFSGKHWNNWKIDSYLCGDLPKYSTVKGEDGVYRSIEIKPRSWGLLGKAFKQIPKPNRKYDFETIWKLKSIPWAIWYYIVYFVYEYILPIFHCIPSYTELDAMDKGWRKAFGIQMCKDIRRQLIKEHRLFSYRIQQIKEKFGCLCWYDNGYTKEMQEILDKYEYLSEHTCIVCGKPAKWMTSYEVWRCPYCEEHVPDNINEKFLEEIKDEF